MLFAAFEKNATFCLRAQPYRFSASNYVIVTPQNPVTLTKLPFPKKQNINRIHKMRQFDRPITANALSEREKWIIKASALVEIIYRYIQGDDPEEDQQGVAKHQALYPQFTEELHNHAVTLLSVLSDASRNRFIAGRSMEFTARTRFNNGVP